MDASDADRRVLDALWIRRYALDLLSGRAPEAVAVDRTILADAEAWRSVLVVERCAIALFEVQAFQDLLPGLAEPVRAVLDRFRLRELKRAMSVQAQLLPLAEAASREGWRVVVLKGGVAIAEGHYVDVQDLDVLALPEEISPIVHMLETAGAAAAVGREVAIGAEGTFHLKPRRAPHALQVEVHHAVRGLGPADLLVPRAEPLLSHPGLSRLSRADHLYHLLFHATIHHPGRAGSLRDILLVAMALGSSPPDSVEAARQRIAQLRYPRSGLQFLELALSFRSGLVTRDPFTAIAASHYLAAARRGRRERVPLYTATVHHLLHGRSQYLEWVRMLMEPNGAPSTVPWVNRLAAWSPRLMTGGRRAHRGAILAAVLPGSLAFARHADRLARRFEEERAAADR